MISCFIVQCKIKCKFAFPGSVCTLCLISFWGIKRWYSIKNVGLECTEWWGDFDQRTSQGLNLCYASCLCSTHANHIYFQWHICESRLKYFYNCFKLHQSEFCMNHLSPFPQPLPNKNPPEFCVTSFSWKDIYRKTCTCHKFQHTPRNNLPS